MSLALARKYRPRNFATVAVQSHVANTLKGAIARDRVAHGYLLCGPRGTGKTTLARVLAMALNCERRGDPALAGEPCGQCGSCQRIWSGSASLDVVEIDAASNRGVDDARELRERAMYAPSGDDRYKVYIVDEAHMLTREAWNALLKVLEEPPPRVVFVFATTEPQKIAQAAAPVLSRLQRFDLKRIGPAEIRERLAAVLTEEQVAFEPDALGLIARAADGGLRDALSLTDQVLSVGETAEVTTARVHTALGLVPDEEYLALLDLVADRRAADVFPAVQRLADAGVDFALVLAGLGDLLRAQLALALGGTPPELPERLRAALAERVGRHAANDLLRMLHALLELEPMYRRSGQPQLLLETLLVRFALLDRTIELEEVLKGFAEGGHDDPPPRRVAHEQRVASAHALPPAPPAAVAPALAPPVPTSATQRAAAAAARAQEAAAAAPPPSPAVAPERVSGAPAPLLDEVERGWSAVCDALRARGRGMVAQGLSHLRPVAISGEGALTIGYAAADDTWAHAAEQARSDVLAALQATFEGVRTFTLKRDGTPGAAPATSAATAGTPTRRLTADDVQKQRTSHAARRAPLLEAAVKALDLEILD
ncbi:MAG: DNA polymerase III subunit gamma/tau [Gemmatimonadetes bacterium]|nr:DNA polymerase III subunit gamma/tau [Gemmatimonadota bacterium]